MLFLNDNKNILKYFSIYNTLNFLLIISVLFGIGVFNSFSSFYVLLILFKIFRNKDFNFFKQKWFILSMIFYLTILSTAFFSEYFELIFLKNIYNLRFPLIALCIQYSIKNKKEFLFLIKCVFFSAVFVGIDALFQYFTGVNLFGNNISEILENRKRLTGVFGDEEIVGSYIIKFFIIGFCFILTKKLNGYVNILIFLFFGFIILLSQERMAFLLFCLSIFIIFIFLILEKKKKILFFSIFLIFSISYLVFKLDSTLMKRYTQTFTNSGSGLQLFYNKDESSELKLKDLNFKKGVKDSMWGAHFLTAYEIFKDNPLTGSGPRTFKYECSKKKYEDRIDSIYKSKRCSTHPHNFYYEILSENGFFVFIYILVVILIFYFNEIKTFIKQKNIIQGFLFLSIFINIWPIASTGSIHASMNGFAIWFTIGIIFGYKNYLKNLAGLPT